MSETRYYIRFEFDPCPTATYRIPATSIRDAYEKAKEFDEYKSIFLTEILVNRIDPPSDPYAGMSQADKDLAHAAQVRQQQRDGV